MLDETHELQNLIDNTPTNGSLTLKKNWHCNGTITISKPIRIFFDGFYIKAITDFSETLDGTSTTRLARRARAHVRIIDTDSVELMNPWVIGANPNGGLSADAYDPDAEAQHGFDIIRSSDIAIYDAIVSDVYGDFVYVGKYSHHVVVDTLHGRRNGRQGIAVSSGYDIVFRNLDLDLVRRTMIDLEPNRNSESIDRVLIENSTFGEARLNFLSCSSAAGHIGDVTLRDLTTVMPFRSNIGSSLVENRGPFYLSNLSHVKWHGSPQQSCIKAINVNTLVVDNCSFPTQPGRNMHFINAENSSNVVVSNTKLPNAVDVAHPDSEPVLEFGNSVGSGPTLLPS